jgi:anti-anti-sigma factor
VALTNRYVYAFGPKIVISNADSLREEIETIFNDAAVTCLVFDLQNVTECDSYGIKTLIDFHRRADAAGKRLLFYRPSENLRELFKITKLDEVFEISYSLE